MIPRRLHSPDPPPEGASSEKFEQLLARLEEIVSDMEMAELPLDKLLSSYEEGMRLVKACGDRLADAEQKVEILSKSIIASPDVKAAAVSDSTPPAPSAPEEDIRLF